MKTYIDYPIPKGHVQDLKNWYRKTNINPDKSGHAYVYLMEAGKERKLGITSNIEHRIETIEKQFNLSITHHEILAEGPRPLLFELENRAHYRLRYKNLYRKFNSNEWYKWDRKKIVFKFFLEAWRLAKSNRCYFVTPGVITQEDLNYCLHWRQVQELNNAAPFPIYNKKYEIKVFTPKTIRRKKRN